MASNQLTQQTKYAIMETLDKLFGRMLTGFKCPLTLAQRYQLARCNLSDETLEAILRVEERCHSTLREVVVVIYTIAKAGGNGTLMFKLRASDAPDHPEPTFFGIAVAPTCTNRDAIAYRLGCSTAHDFFMWLDQAVDLSEDILCALQTAKDVMDMAKTPGQLRRMVPELYAVAPLNQKITQSQRSALPYKWAEYPRRNVELLVDLMAKCKLLSEDDDNALWSKRQFFTWPIVQEKP